MLSSSSRTNVSFGWKKVQKSNQTQPAVEHVQAEIRTLSISSPQHSSSITSAATESSLSSEMDVNSEASRSGPEFSLPQPDPRRCREMLRAGARSAPLQRPQPTALAEMFAPDSEEPFEQPPDAEAELDERFATDDATLSSVSERIQKLRDAGVRLAEAHK